MLGEYSAEADAGLGVAQRGRDFLGVVADGGDDADAGDDDASHAQSSFQVYRRRSGGGRFV